MTKAIFCVKCFDLRMLRPEGPVSCYCGNVVGEWIDPARGSCRITAKSLVDAALVGLNNDFILLGLKRIRTSDRGDRFGPEDGLAWRSFHAIATDAPGYYFDKSIRDCWAIIMGHRDAVAGVEWVELDPCGKPAGHEGSCA